MTSHIISAYVETLPASARPHLVQQLDWDHRGFEKDLNEIAHVMLDWEVKLRAHLGLTEVDVHDIMRDISNLELQRRAALTLWQSKQGIRATYGNLLELFVQAGHTQCAEVLCEVLRKKSAGKKMESESLSESQEESQQDRSVSTSLPSIIDAAVAINAFRRNYSDLSNIIHDTLPSLANDLFAKSIITNKVREKVLNTSLGTIDRAATLLDATQTKIRVNPSDFIAFIEILDSEPYLKSTAKRLVQSYLEYAGANRSPEASPGPTQRAVLKVDMHREAYEKAIKNMITVCIRVVRLNCIGLPRSGKTLFLLRLMKEIKNYIEALDKGKILPENPSTGAVKCVGNVYIKKSLSHKIGAILSKEWHTLKSLAEEGYMILQLIRSQKSNDSLNDVASSTGKKPTASPEQQTKKKLGPVNLSESEHTTASEEEDTQRFNHLQRRG